MNKNTNFKFYFGLLVMVTMLFPSYSLAMNDPVTDSPYRKAGNFIFISSQVPINPVTHKLVSSDVNQQVRQVLENLREKVIESGAEMKDVIKLTLYLEDIDSVFPVVKEYIPQYFEPPYPARSPVPGLSFGKTGFKIAIDAILYVNQENQGNSL
jgi:2-iminobutanoate/2-iminopropanoate deaminase